MTTIGFCTPVSFDKRDYDFQTDFRAPKQRFGDFCDNFFFSGGKKAYVLSGSDRLVELKDEDVSTGCIALKVIASLLTGLLLPLILFIGKLCCRCSHPYQVYEPPQFSGEQSKKDVFALAPLPIREGIIDSQTLHKQHVAFMQHVFSLKAAPAQDQPIVQLVQEKAQLAFCFYGDDNHNGGYLAQIQVTVLPTTEEEPKDHTLNWSVQWQHRMDKQPLRPHFKICSSSLWGYIKLRQPTDMRFVYHSESTGSARWDWDTPNKLNPRFYYPTDEDMAAIMPKVQEAFRRVLESTSAVCIPTAVRGIVADYATDIHDPIGSQAACPVIADRWFRLILKDLHFQHRLKNTPFKYLVEEPKTEPPKADLEQEVQGADP